MTEMTPTPQPCEAKTAGGRRRFSIGLPACAHDNRFALTPEAAGQLIENGFIVKMQQDAAMVIHYTDHAYSRRGVMIVTREEALKCDIVIHPSLPAISDVASMRRGAMLLTMSSFGPEHREVYRRLLDRAVVTIALDLITDSRGNRPFADILSEIDGRAALVIAASMMADIHGKGILPGGISGVIPCEVTIIGSDIAARAAARSASGLGAIVRMFDNDTYCLRDAMQQLGQQVIGSTLHRRVLDSALATADMIIVTSSCGDLTIDAEAMRGLKAGVIAMDLRRAGRDTFTSLPEADLSRISVRDIPVDVRVCLVNTGNAVPRTAAMALSDTLMTMLREVVSCEGVTNALKLSKGLQGATLTFLGKAVNPLAAKSAGVRHTDINLFLQFS